MECYVRIEGKKTYLDIYKDIDSPKIAVPLNINLFEHQDLEEYDDGYKESAALKVITAIQTALKTVFKGIFAIPLAIIKAILKFFILIFELLNFVRLAYTKKK